MTYGIFTPILATFDGNGVPRAGAKLFFYQTGTTTPQATYADGGLVSLNSNPVVADANGLFPPIYFAPGPDYKAILQDQNSVTIATRDPVPAPALPGALPALRGYIDGLVLSTGGGSNIFSIAAGAAADSTNAVTMNLSSMAKNTNAWVVGSGNGALDTGSISTNTWYHVFCIQRSDTGAVDSLISLSTSPTMPANYNYKRRIGSLLTDGSAHFTAFVQDGDLFQWKTLVSDVNGVTNSGSAAVTRTLSVPPGVNVIALIQGLYANSDGATASVVYLSDLATTDSTPTNMVANGIGDTPALSSAAGFIARGAFLKSVRTNTSSQIRSRESLGNTNCTLTLNTLGWIDHRGRDS